MKTPFSFYTAPEYRDDLLVALQKAKPGDRVLLMSMTMEPTEPIIGAIMRQAELAASRGVHVTIAIDAHSFLVNDRHVPGPLWTRRRLPEKLSPYYKHKLQILERISAFPTGHAVIINTPKNRLSLPIAGRSHIKAAIINDRIYIGGCNLQAAASVDLMVSWKSQSDADGLYAMLQQIIHGRDASRALAGVDRCLTISNHAKLFIDSGKKHQSKILDEALKMIDNAEEWLVITCQFFPNSITAKHLLQAQRRGVKVEIIYSHPAYHGAIGGLGQQVSILRERTRVPRELFAHALGREDPMLHAKLIATDKGVMVGSHNYVRAGVMLGTAEIAFQSMDENLSRSAVETLHRGLHRHVPQG